jgi:hypothetical protein
MQEDNRNPEIIRRMGRNGCEMMSFNLDFPGFFHDFLDE